MKHVFLSSFRSRFENKFVDNDFLHPVANIVLWVKASLSVDRWHAGMSWGEGALTPLVLRWLPSNETNATANHHFHLPQNDFRIVRLAVSIPYLRSYKLLRDVILTVCDPIISALSGLASYYRSVNCTERPH